MKDGFLDRHLLTRPEATEEDERRNCETLLDFWDSVAVEDVCDMVFDDYRDWRLENLRQGEGTQDNGSRIEHAEQRVHLLQTPRRSKGEPAGRPAKISTEFESPPLSGVLRIALHEELEETVSKLNQKRETLKISLENDRNTKESIKVELARDKVGSRLREIELERQLASTRRDQKLQNLNGLKVHLGALGKPVVLETEAQFSDLRQKLLMEQGATKGNKETQEQKKVEHALAKENAEQERSRIAAEAQSIREHQVLIPVEFANIRKGVCDASGASGRTAPFRR